MSEKDPIPEEERLRSPARGIQKSYSVSQRLRSALFSFGDRTERTTRFREALLALQKHPKLMMRENIGVDEVHYPCLISGLTQDDLNLIERLNRELGLLSDAAVVRNAIEWLINTYNLDEYRKPPGWVSRPLHIQQVGDKGENPMPKVGGDSTKLWLPLPASLFARLKDLTASDRYRRSQGETRSSFVRSAISQVDWRTIAPLTPEELAEPKKAFSFNLLNQQVSDLDAYLNQSQEFGSLAELIAAIIKQAINQQ